MLGVRRFPEVLFVSYATMTSLGTEYKPHKVKDFLIFLSYKLCLEKL